MPNNKDIDYFPTFHALIENLTEYLNLTPEQKFRVAAKIKRHIHQEKSDFARRMHMFCRGPGIYEGEGENRKKIGEQPPADPFLSETLDCKAKTHEWWAKLPDEEIITYDMGSHVFIQKRPPCSECKVELTGTVETLRKIGGYMTTREKGVTIAHCKPCAEKKGIWDVEED